MEVLREESDTFPSFFIPCYNFIKGSLLFCFLNICLMCSHACENGFLHCFPIWFLKSWKIIGFVDCVIWLLSVNCNLAGFVVPYISCHFEVAFLLFCFLEEDPYAFVKTDGLSLLVLDAVIEILLRPKTKGLMMPLKTS